MKYVKEITIKDLQSSYDWAEVFGEGDGGNTDRTVSETPPGSSVSTALVSRADVTEIIAAVNGENDGQSWVGLFLMQDGRYLIASGSCDYTGWDCREGNSLTVAATKEDAIRFGLDEGERARLGINFVE